MQIQVLGSGCPTCKNLYEITEKAVEEMGLDTKVEYITDITKMIEMGIMTSPVLMVDGTVVMSGSSNDKERIKELITNCKEIQEKEMDSDGNPKGCNCGAGCCE